MSKPVCAELLEIIVSKVKLESAFKCSDLFC